MFENSPNLLEIVLETEDVQPHALVCIAHTTFVSETTILCCRGSDSGMLMVCTLTVFGCKIMDVRDMEVENRNMFGVVDHF